MTTRYNQARQDRQDHDDAQAYADRIAELDSTTGAATCVHGHRQCADREGGRCVDEVLSLAGL